MKSDIDATVVRVAVVAECDAADDGEVVPAAAAEHAIRKRNTHIHTNLKMKSDVKVAVPWPVVAAKRGAAVPRNGPPASA